MDGQLRIDASGLNIGRLSKVDEATPAALLKGIQHLRDAAAPKVPLETGHLVGEAEPRVVSDDRASLTFPGPYAAYQEFGLDLHHPVAGQALYLTSTMIEEKDSTLGVAAQVYRDAL